MMEEHVSPQPQTPPSNSASEISQYINIENAKLVALIIVIGFVAYHGSLHLKYGEYSLFYLLFFLSMAPSSSVAAQLCDWL